MVLRVETLITGLRGSPGYNRLHFADPLFEDLDGAQAAVTAVNAFWDALAPIVTSAVTFTIESEVTELDNTGAAIGSFLVPSPGGATGTSSGEPLPWSTQALVRLRTGVYLNRREVRGRIFIPGLTEISNVGGGMSQIAFTTIQDAADALAAFTPALQVLTSQGPVEVALTSVWSQWAMLTSRRD